MSVTVIIVAVVAVVAIGVLVMLSRRGPAGVEEGKGRGEAEQEPAKVTRAAEVGPVAAVPSEAKASGAASEEAAVPATAEAAPSPPPSPSPSPPEPEESEEEVAERVKGSLAEARRMLAELQEKAGDAADEGGQPGAMEIMAEGLEEVEALADGGKLGQARDKAEALHAQLSLMLQAARRESSSG